MTVTSHRSSELNDKLGKYESRKCSSVTSTDFACFDVNHSNNPNFFDHQRRRFEEQILDNSRHFSFDVSNHRVLHSMLKESSYVNVCSLFSVCLLLTEISNLGNEYNKSSFKSIKTKNKEHNNNTLAFQ